MPFELFANRFPDLGPRETRTLTVLDDDHRLPRGRYSFVEMYCNESSCDCRRAFIQIHRDDVVAAATSWPDPLATISYGWEPDDFYRAWAGWPLTDHELELLRGPALEPFNPQSVHSEALLDAFKTYLLTDDAYVERIIRHYGMFRERIDAVPQETPQRKTTARKNTRKRQRTARRKQRRRKR